jgi:tetratricopeptide (TPR) repeat protein
LSGDTLYPPTQTDDVRAGNEQRLAAAREAYEADPGSADALIWLGRRTAYLGRYREAIEIYTTGIDEHRDDARMYRHRGHRYLSVRRFDLATADLQHAAELIRGTTDEVEPDGIPNARNIPTSTLHFNIWYHLGLAQYLVGRYDDALDAYRECLQVSNNPDAKVATSYWLYMTLRRLERDSEAEAVLASIGPDMDIIENQSYHRLLLLNKGQLSREDLLDTGGEDDVPLANATVGYGVGMWLALGGRTPEAEEAWQAVLAGSQWAAFGFIAAEAEMAR